MKVSLIKAKHVLIFCILSYVLVTANAYLNPNMPGGVDAANHLFQTWFIKEYGLASWNPYWYAGSPLLDQYPPLTHIFSAFLASVLGVVNGYKVAYAIGFIMLPVSFYLLLKEFPLNDKEKGFALLMFSFSVIYVHYFQEGVYSSLLSFNLVMLYFKYLKKTIDAGGYKNTLTAALFLGLSALSHALNPVYAVVFSIPLVLVYSYKKIKELVIILCLTAFLTAWFWIPYFVNYNSPKSTPQGLDLLTLPTEFGRAFVVSANYLGIAATILLATAIAYTTYKNIRHGKDRKYTIYMALIFLTMILLRFIPILGLQETKRALFFAPMFLSIYVAKAVSDMRYGKIASLFMIAPLVLLFFAYPPVTVDVNQDVTGVISIIKESPGERVLFLPERFDIMTVNKSDFPVAEDTYASFLVPYMTGKQVVNGLWSVGAISVNKPQEYGRMTNMKCQDTKTYQELLSDASWINKNTLGERKICEPKLDASTYCDTAAKASLDLIVVNTFFPEVVSYVGGLSCVEKTWENANFIVYRLKEKKPYIYFDDEGIGQNHSRDLGTIKIDLTANEAKTTRVHVAESYVNHWKAYLDEKEMKVERDSDGYITLGIGIAPGKHVLLLEYLPQRFGNVFSYVSVASWIILFAGLILIKEKKSR